MVFEQKVRQQELYPLTVPFPDQGFGKFTLETVLFIIGNKPNVHIWKIFQMAIWVKELNGFDEIGHCGANFYLVITSLFTGPGSIEIAIVECSYFSRIAIVIAKAKIFNDD